MVVLMLDDGKKIYNLNRRQVLGSILRALCHFIVH